jgi:DNA/RNA endonuclease YhcR with UshA esterase domain
MTSRTRLVSTTRMLAVAVALIALSACATTPIGGALVVGQQATVEGDVVSVDTNPWAYDGNAVVMVSTTGAGTVSVQLPARWNLCKAQPLGDVQAFKPGDRVQVVGTVTATGEMVVCAEQEHRLRKIE